jgi:methylated-DNA-[protein]-cysteine S-methyltransferase
MKITQEFTEKLADSAVADGLADALFATASSPVGDLLVVVSREGVCRIGFGDEDIDEVLSEVADGLGPRILRSAAHTRMVTDQLEAFFSGGEEFDLPVDFSLVRSAFQRRVLDALGDVPLGQVTTYREIADDIGHPRAARAVGTALGRNPIPIVVPCHRVLPSGGGVGGYGGGPDRKRYLLTLEGVEASRLSIRRAEA